MFVITLTNKKYYKFVSHIEGPPEAGTMHNHLRDGCGGLHDGLHGDDEKHTYEFYEPF